MEREAVGGWLTRYVQAWRSYDRAAIEGLFADHAEYRYHPWDEPLRGGPAIADDWLRDRDEADTWDAEYVPYAADGDVAVATGVSRYYTDATRSTLDRTYHNVFLLRFGADGRCVSFTEVFLRAPSEG